MECPNDRLPLTEDFMANITGADRDLRLAVENLELKCPHHKKGCTWTGTLKQVKKHLNSDCDWLMCTFVGCEKVHSRRSTATASSSSQHQHQHHADNDDHNHLQLMQRQLIVLMDQIEAGNDALANLSRTNLRPMSDALQMLVQHNQLMAETTARDRIRTLYSVAWCGVLAVSCWYLNRRERQINQRIMEYNRNLLFPQDVVSSAVRTINQTASRVVEASPSFINRIATNVSTAISYLWNGGQK